MSPWRQLRRTRSAILLALIPGLLGVGLTFWGPAINLEKSGGLDALFVLRGQRTPPAGVCVVAIDDDSYDVEGQDRLLGWPRGRHADLIRTLKREGAKAVAFDVLFDQPGADPAQDEEFRAALAEAKNVVLGASIVVTEDPMFRQAQLQEPIDAFKAAAKATAYVNIPT